MRNYIPTLTRFYDSLAALKDRRIPQMCVSGLAVFSIILGWLFLNVADRFGAAPAMQYLTNAVPPRIWGMLFLSAGAFLAAVAWVNFQRAVWPCFLFAIGMAAFTILSTVDLLEGPATGVVAVMAGLIAWFSACTGILCIAPDVADRLHRQEGETA